MKKILSILLVLMLVATCSACSASSKNNNDTADDTATVKYYPNTNVPTLDSLFDETELRGTDGYYVYGTYSTESDAKVVMDLYLSALVSNYKFTRIDTSVGYQATDGTNTVTIIGGNWESEFAVCVMIE